MIETNIQNQKELFLKSEFFMLSWTAAVQQRNEGVPKGTKIIKALEGVLWVS